ncbi:hypothetical protein GCM10023221_09540 [Luteimicrobium xylanilyticum]|uniref:Macrolide export ATP-binding/permease protein MacB n=1 Tax=Luteimicrobium xylanilyticum TaxID=1133546 RepID=A0A5P9QGK2_9MICO|nr:FtsX-like permease family protein [Luteimicrobium xylanilyticum]QFV00213.1 Macrolide export ATP-binding/permease protein MacB [Luteimicrobium xylanilyticum]
MRDALTHVATNITRAWGRSAAFAAAAFLAAGLLAFGVTQASSSQDRITGDFDSLAATRLQVTTPIRGLADPILTRPQMTAIEHIRGVVAVAWVTSRDVSLAADPRTPTSTRLWTVYENPAALGLTLDNTTSQLTAGLYLGGASDLARAGLPRFSHVFVGGTPVILDGTVTSSPVLPDLLQAALLVRPATEPDLSTSGELVVQVHPGWANYVGDRLATQIAPGNESSVLVAYPPEPANLRDSVTGSVSTLVLLVSAALLVVGALAVTVGTFFRVMAERRLLGLYRAIGASRVFVSGTIVLEAAITGTIGGLTGTLAGVAAAAVWALVSETALSIPGGLLALGVLASLVANTLGSLLPAVKAVREPPLAAIRAR